MKDQSAPAGETKSTESKTDDTTKPADGPAKQPGTAPEAYKPFTVADGKPIDAKELERVTPIFKELGLTQDQGQKLIDLQAQYQKQHAEQAEAQIKEMIQGWRDQVKNDKEMGSKLEAVSADIGRLKAILPADVREEFNKVMNETGFGDHPAIVKSLWHIARKLGEGVPVTGAGPSVHGQTNGKAAPKSLAGAMYPNLPQ